MNRSNEVILGVTGSIAAYKAAQLASDIRKKDIRVTAIMTDTAQRFVTTLTFESITGNAVITDIECESEKRVAEHVALADRCSALIIAPATANIIGKIAAGIADDILSTTALSFDGPVIIAPAMNNRMWSNGIVQENVTKLKTYGVVFVGPDTGRLADGREGTGRMAEPSEILTAVETAIKK